MPRSRISRRCFVVSCLLGTCATSATGAVARTIAPDIPWLPGTAPVPQGPDEARFFTAPERRCVDALTARLIPTDEAGPGAREAGVVDFIDRQLAGFYGRGDRWYMRGPFADGTGTQGYQSQYPPAQLYRRAIAGLDRISREHHGGRHFADLSDAEQDAILKRMEGNDLDLGDVSAGTFLELLQENTIEGFFCDPIYGGNRDMVGWKLVGFPGARYDYRDFLDHNGSPIQIAPVGLRGRPAWTTN